MDKVSVHTAFRAEAIEMYPDEAESLRLQGLTREPPAASAPAADTAKATAKPDPKDAAK